MSGILLGELARRARWAVAAVSAFALVPACSSSGDQGPAGTGGGAVSTEGFCSDMCARTSACDSTKDQQTCAAECSNAFAVVLPKLRNDVVSALESCMGSKDCKTVLGGKLLGVCIDEVIASVAPAPAGTAFCAKWDAAVAKCGSRLDKAECLSQSKLYSDAALGAATACTDKACSDISRCIDASFGATHQSRDGG